jgi:hypothetical protein
MFKARQKNTRKRIEAIKLPGRKKKARIREQDKYGRQQRKYFYA